MSKQTDEAAELAYFNANYWDFQEVEVPADYTSLIPDWLWKTDYKKEPEDNSVVLYHCSRWLEYGSLPGANYEQDTLERGKVVVENALKELGLDWKVTLDN